MSGHENRIPFSKGPATRHTSRHDRRRVGKGFFEGLESRLLMAGDGLLAAYFDNPDFAGASVTRVDPTVRLDARAGDSPAKGIAPFTYSARWTGQVEARYSETYTFATTSDDGVRLWVDGRKVIDHWTRHAPKVDAGRVTLQAGKKYDIRMEYFQNYGGAVAKLQWSSASQQAEVVPQSHLYSTRASVPAAIPAPTPAAAVAASTGTGLAATYFNNADLTGTTVARVDPGLQFEWGPQDAPAAGISPDTYSARWTGQLQPRYSETYTFLTTADDGVRLWVNGQLLVDRWGDRAPLVGDGNGDGRLDFADYQILEGDVGTYNRRSDLNADGVVDYADATLLFQNFGKTLATTAPTDTGTIALQAGQRYDVKVEYRQSTGPACATLEWQSASQSREVVPATQLYPASAITPPPLAGDWRVTFSDEFTTSALNPVWHTAQWWDRDYTVVGEDELQAYDASGVSVSNGMLHLTARREEKYPGTPYVSGMVMTGGFEDAPTMPRYSFKYGYMEVRAKFPAGQGFFPAIWMMPASYNDGNGELDVMEMLGNDPTRANFTLHRNGRNDGNEWVGPDFTKGFHTFGVDWQADHVTWYVDGVERARSTDPALICPEASYPILNLAVGGNWGGPPDASTPFPSTMDVDYVRIWQKP